MILISILSHNSVNKVINDSKGIDSDYRKL